MIRMSLLITVTAAALFSLSIAGIAGNGEAPDASRSVAPAAVSNCSITAKRIEVAQSSTFNFTSSTTFTDLPGSIVSFTTSAPGCVILSFSAQAFAPNGDSPGGLMFVRALLDGATVSVDGRIQLQSDSIDFSNAHGYNFLFPIVSSGAHDVRMQYSTLTDGKKVFINDFDTIVYHH